MAEFVFEGLDQLALSLREVAEISDAIQDQILEEQADALVLELQRRGEGYGVVPPDSAGLRSIRKGKPKRGKNGAKQIVVKPRGRSKRSKTPYSAVLFFRNYGTRTMPALPFWTDTVALSAGTLDRIAQDIFNQWIESKGF